jgi:hypothetical protein
MLHADLHLHSACPSPSRAVRRDLLPDGLAEAVPQVPAAADLHRFRQGLPNGLAVGPGPCRSAPLDAANVRGQSLPRPHVAGPCAAAVHHGPIVPTELANLGMSSATNVRIMPRIARSDGGPCGLAGRGNGDCRRGLGGNGEWVMEWQRSTLRLAHVMWSRRKRGIDYRRAAGNTRGSRSSTGVRGPSCCQRLGATRQLRRRWPSRCPWQWWRPARALRVPGRILP